MKKYLEIGKIVNTHGVRGTVKAEPWCDSPAVLAGMKRVYFAPAGAGEDYRETEVLHGSVQKDRVLLTLRGITDVEQAKLLKNTLLYADREDIPVTEGAYLIADLIGLPVDDAVTGRNYGTLSDVLQGAAGDIYEIDTPSGRVLMPAVKEYVASVEPEKAIYITPIPGFFEGPEKDGT